MLTLREYDQVKVAISAMSTCLVNGQPHVPQHFVTSLLLTYTEGKLEVKQDGDNLLVSVDPK
jgi:hypothetical protein